MLTYADVCLYSGQALVHLGNVHHVKSECWTTLITIWTILALIIFLHLTLTKSMRTEILGYSVYIFYWYKSTNTDA